MRLVLPPLAPRVPSKRRLCVLGTLLMAGLGLAAGCFIETQPPPTFRFQCANDDECADGEQCRSGLCQVPCTTETFSEDCSIEDGYAACFNGNCTHICQLSDDRCSKPHTCLELPVEVVEPEPGQPPASDFGFCAESCEQTGCPDSEVCLSGICFATCDVNDPNPFPCGTGATCISDVCVPNAIFNQL